MQATPSSLRERAPRFWARVDKTSTCWLWLGALDKDGYGLTSFQNKTWRAPRLAYLLAHPEHRLTADDLVCHRCDNPRCVRPRHLKLGNTISNVNDRVRRGRNGHGPAFERRAWGERHGRAKLTLHEIRAIRRSRASQRALARQFHISRRQIGRIRRGLSWSRDRTAC